MEIRQKLPAKKIIYLFLGTFFIVSVLLPIISMFMRITHESAEDLVRTPQFLSIFHR